MGVAQGVPVAFIQAGDQTTTGGFGAFMDMITYLLGLDNPPQVLTTSYGFDETGLDPGDANNLCNAYMQLGARGTSILFSSGDGGVAGSQTTRCTTFLTTFPSGCPLYVRQIILYLYNATNDRAS